MPGAIAVWAAGAFLAAAPGLGIGIAGAIGWLAGGAALVLSSVGLSMISTALMGRPRVPQSPMPRTGTVADSVHPRTIVYGAARVGGVILDQNTCGNKNEFFDFIIAVAGHEVEAITDVWFDDIKIANADINAGNPVGGVVTGGKFTNRAWIFKHLGTETQTVDALMRDSYGYWDDSHRCLGIAYVHLRLRRDADVYTTGMPAQFTFFVYGAKVYDPRLDSSNGGVGPQRLEVPSTWAWSRNSALCSADYIIGGTLTNGATRRPQRGYGADPSEVEWPRVIAAANICDEAVVVPRMAA